MLSINTKKTHTHTHTSFAADRYEVWNKNNGNRYNFKNCL